MKKSAELGPPRLYHRSEPENFSFDSTADLEDLTQFIGQPRAVEALRFGVGIEREGYNVFALGTPGTGKHTLVKQFLETRAAEEPVPSDISYVNNFEQSHKPRILRLESGRGKTLSEDTDQLIEDVRNALGAAFENEEYQNRRRTITQEFQEEQENAFKEVQGKAQEKNLTIIRSPSGLVFAPMKEGEVIQPDEFNKLPEDEQERVKQQGEELHKESQKILQKIPVWEREMREKIKALNREVTGFTLSPMIEVLRKKYDDLPDVVSHLDAVEKDIIDNAQSLLQTGERHAQQQKMQQLLSGGGSPQQDGGPQEESPQLRRYKVYVLVDHGESKGAPVIYETNPTHQNLVGRVEHLAKMGMLMTNFNMIRPGALHRANGGDRFGQSARPDPTDRRGQ